MVWRLPGTTATTPGVICAMLSNGLLITPHTALQLKEQHQSHRHTHRNSVVPANHDHLRNLPGTFNKAVSQFKPGLDIDLEVVVTTMALKDTFNEMPQRIEFL